MRIAADRFAERVLNGRSKCFGESLRVALLAAFLDCFGDDGAYVLDAAPSVVEALLDFLEAFLLGADDEMAELFVSVGIRRIAIAGGVIYRRVLGCILLRGSALGLLGHVGRLQFLTG